MGSDRTGLPLATYFSGPKLRWLLDHVPGARDRAAHGDLLAGTIDAWLIWNLTGGPSGGVHVTDVTNAGRTMLMNLHTLEWDPVLLDVIGVPATILPTIRSSSEVYGVARGMLDGVPVAGVNLGRVGFLAEFAPEDMDATIDRQTEQLADWTKRVPAEEERIAARVLMDKPDGVLVVADALNLSRSLFLASQIIEHQLPVVIALNMIDLAESAGVKVDPAKLTHELGCPVVPIVARTGQGLPALKAALDKLKVSRAPATPATTCGACDDCRFKTRYAWTDAVAGRVVTHQPVVGHRWTERLDQVVTHPVLGIVAFTLVMVGVFFLIFQLATIPMDLIDGLFSHVGVWVAQHLPENDFRDLLVKGVIGGMGGMLLFQLLVNVGMVLGIMPITGIPLPFVTHGGASLVSIGIGLGVLESIAMRRGRPAG